MIVLMEMNYLITVKPYHLNTFSLGLCLVSTMFGWRKRGNSSDINACPYCNTPNSLDATECKLCYYDLKRSAREQPMASPDSTESDIMSTLMDNNLDDEQEDEYAVEAVLSLDDITVEIDQFDVPSEEQEPDFDFIKSTGPTLSEVQDYEKPEEAELTKLDAPSSKIDFIVPKNNPLDEVEEPIHTGQGSLFTVESESSEDLSGSVGPSNKGKNMEPEIIGEEQTNSRIDLTSAIKDEPPLEVTTPEVPDIPEISKTNESSQQEISTPEVPDIPEIETIVQTVVQTPVIPDIPGENVVESMPTNAKIEKPEAKTAPIPQTNGRIWPWPAKEVWDERQVYREVVSMLELIKTGKLSQTAQQLDALGPHLNKNLDMLAHIGTIMRYLGREEHLQWMLKMAQITYPGDENVSKAISHLT